MASARVIAVDVDIAAVREEGAGGGFAARVDSFEGEICAGFDGGLVLVADEVAGA